MITPFDTEATVKGQLKEDLSGPILFFHGQESGPFGSKFRALQESFGYISSPDFSGLGLTDRLARAEEVTRDLTGLIVVGSSMGGILAALLANQFPERFFGMVLVAPALHWPGTEGITRVPGMTEILMGSEDDIVPLGPVQAFARKHSVTLTMTPDDHRMGKSLTEIIQVTQSMATRRDA